MAFNEVGIEIEFRGKNEEEKGYIVKCNNPEYQIEIGKNVVAVDKRYYRPTEVDLLIGDATKARTKLNWTPRYDLPALVKDMVKSDVKLMKKERYLRDGGYQTMNYFE